MRKLITSDIFTCARVVKTSGIRAQLKSFVQKLATKGDLDREDVGYDTVLMLIEAMTEKEVESAIYEVLSGPFEVSANEIKEMEIPELVNNLHTLVVENDLKSFFKYLSDILGKN